GEGVVAQHEPRLLRGVRGAVDEGYRELAAVRADAGGRVDEGERAEVGDAVRPAAGVLRQLRGDDRAVHVHVDGGSERGPGVQQERVVDRLDGGGGVRGDDRGDRVDHLGQVRHPDTGAVPDEDVEVRGDREGVVEGVA